MLACAFAALLPVAYSGLGYAGLGYGHPGLVAPAPLAYSGVPVPAATFPTYETVSHTVDVTHEPVEQHGYVVKY